MRSIGFCVALLVVVVGKEGQTADSKTAAEFYERGQKREDVDPDGELADFTRVIELDPNFAEGFWSRSSLHADQRRHKLAILDLSAYLKLRPGDNSALFNRALYRSYVDDFDLAFEDYNDILDGDVDLTRWGGTKNEALAHAHHYRGRLFLEHTKDYKEAIKDFTKSIELNSGKEMIRYRRGMAWHAVGEYAKAEADYVDEMALQPEYSNLLNARAWQMATCPDARFRDGPKAISLATKACERFEWKDPDYIATLAAACAEDGRFDQAVEKQKLAISLLNDSHEARRKTFEERLALFEKKQPYREPPVKQRSR
jgi:tetratricopeptide (TPR) repeat protein